MVIWKFHLLASENTIQMPKGAKSITVANQYDNVMLWAIVDSNAPNETHTFLVIATGEKFDPRGLEYIGTVHGIMGGLVFHVFEKR